MLPANRFTCGERRDITVTVTVETRKFATITHEGVSTYGEISDPTGATALHEWMSHGLVQALLRLDPVDQNDVLCTLQDVW